MTEGWMQETVELKERAMAALDSERLRTIPADPRLLLILIEECLAGGRDRALCFSLPYPPSANRYWRFPPQFRRYASARPLLSAEGRNYRGRVVAALSEQDLLGPRHSLGASRLGIWVNMHPPDNRSSPNAVRAICRDRQAALNCSRGSTASGGRCALLAASMVWSQLCAVPVRPRLPARWPSRT